MTRAWPSIAWRYKQLTQSCLLLLSCTLGYDRALILLLVQVTKLNLRDFQICLNICCRYAWAYQGWLDRLTSEVLGLPQDILLSFVRSRLFLPRMLSVAHSLQQLLSDCRRIFSLGLLATSCFSIHWLVLLASTCIRIKIKLCKRWCCIEVRLRFPLRTLTCLPWALLLVLSEFFSHSTRYLTFILLATWCQMPVHCHVGWETHACGHRELHILLLTCATDIWGFWAYILDGFTRAKLILGEETIGSKTLLNKSRVSLI